MRVRAGVSGEVLFSAGFDKPGFVSYGLNCSTLFLPTVSRVVCRRSSRRCRLAAAFFCLSPSALARPPAVVPFCCRGDAMRIQTVPSDSVDVLIVDDDVLTRQTLRLLLEQRGYRCTEAADGRQ